MAGLDNNTSYGQAGSSANLNTAYNAVRNAINTQYSQLRNPVKKPAAVTVPPRQSWQPVIPQAGGAWQPTAKPQVNWAPGQQPIDQIPYMMPEVNPAQPQYQAPQTWRNTETGEQIEAYVPPDYKTWQAETGKPWVNPSSQENLRFRNVPNSVPGGGQYVVDVGQPGDLVKSQRGLAPWNYEKDPNKKNVYSSQETADQHKTMLGGLDPAGAKDAFGFQVDHIVPLWLGGADTPQNKELLDPITNDKKTRIQAVALTLLSNKVITEPQAKMMALTWRDKDESMVPKELNNGFIDLNTAKEIADNWKKDQSVVKPQSGNGFFGWVKDTWNEMKNLKDFGQETFGSGIGGATIREFMKGTASGASMGYIPYEEDDDYKSTMADTAGYAAGLAGNVVGFMGTFGAFRAGLGLMGRGLAKVGALSNVFGEGKALGQGWEVAKATEALDKALLKTGQVGEAAVKAKKEFDRTLWVGKTLRDAGVFTLYGQLGRGGLVNSMVTGENTPWMNKFITDGLTAGILNKFETPGLASALKTAGSVTILDLMSQSVNSMNGYGDVNFRDALANGLTIGGMHYLGTMNTPKMFNGKAEFGKNYLDQKMSLAKTAAEQQRGPINSKVLDDATQQKIDEFKNMIRNDEVMKKVWYTQGPDAAMRLYQTNAFVAREEFIRSLPTADLQAAERAKDASTMIKYLAENKPAKEVLEQVVENGRVEPANVRISYKTPVQDGEYRLPVAGTFNNDAPWLQQNTQRYIRALRGTDPNKVASTDGYVFFDKELGKVNSDLSKKFENRTYAPGEKPENYGRIFMPIYDKATGYVEMLEVGTLPRTRTIEARNKQNQEYLARNPNATTQLPDFNVTHNVDTIAQKADAVGTKVVPIRIEYGSEGGSIVSKGQQTENTTSLTARIMPDAFQEGKAYSDSFDQIKNTQKTGDTTFEQNILKEAGAPIDVLNAIVDSFKKSVSQNPETFAQKVNEQWGKNTMTAAEAKAAIDNPSFSVGDVFNILKSKSSVWKEQPLFDLFLGDTGFVAKSGNAWKTYVSTPIEAHKSTALPFAEPTTATGNVPVTKFLAPMRPKLLAGPAEATAESTKGAITTAKNLKKEIKGAAQKEVIKKAKKPETPEEKAVVGEKKIASKGVSPEVKKQLIDEGVPPAMVEKAAMQIKQEAKTQYSASVEKTLGDYEVKRDTFPTVEQRDTKSNFSLFERAFNEKENYFGHDVADDAAIKIMRAVGEKNLSRDPKTGVIGIKEGKLSPEEIRAKAGLTNLEFISGIDAMTREYRPSSAGGVIGSPILKKGKNGEIPKYATDDSAIWLARNAKSALEKISNKKDLSYEDGLSLGFLESVRKVIGDKITPETLPDAFGIGPFMKQVGKDSAPMKSSMTGEDVTQPVDLLRSRVKQERGRIGELSKDTRSKLFQKRLDEEAAARKNKELGDKTKTSQEEGTNQERILNSIDEGDRSMAEMDGMTINDASQSLATNATISRLEYSLPGLALRNAGGKVTVTDGMKDGLLLGRNYLKTYNKYSKYQKFVDFAKLEKELRPKVEPEFEKIRPLMEKKELKRVTKEIIKKTEPQTGSSDLVEKPYVIPPSPVVNIQEMIQKYDGADPAGSTKIMETVLKSRGYKKEPGPAYKNVWKNGKYLDILRSTKKVKDAEISK